MAAFRFNGRDWTLADFLPFKYLENWEPFFGDLLVELGLRKQAIDEAVTQAQTAATTAGQHATSAGLAANTAAQILVDQNTANDLTISQTTALKGQAQAAAASAASSAGETRWCGVAGGTANALTLTPANPVTALFDGLAIRFVTPTTNTATAVTLAVSAVAAKPLRDSAGAALVVGAYSAGLVTATYVAASDHWRLAGGAPGTLSLARSLLRI